MGIFFKIFEIFKNNKPQKDLLEAYSKLNNLSSKLEKEISELRIIQKQLIEEKLENINSGDKPTKIIGFKKADFINEDFLRKLRRLAEESELRFIDMENNCLDLPLLPQERENLNKIIELLDEVKILLPDIEEINKINSRDKKIQMIDISLREITKLSKEFYEEELYGKLLIKKFNEREISKLLKEIYEKPKKTKEGILYFYIKKEELTRLQTESYYINSHKDPNFFIEWRRWWKDIQVPEIDKNTPIKDPHINVIIRLFGKPKKDIHLIIAA